MKPHCVTIWIRGIEQYFHVGFILLFKVVGTLLDETLLYDVHMKAPEEYFLMILFNMLNMVGSNCQVWTKR